MKSRLTTTDRMSNTGYHSNGKPNWWARIGSGDSAVTTAIEEASNVAAQ